MTHAINLTYFKDLADDIENCRGNEYVSAEQLKDLIQAIEAREKVIADLVWKLKRITP